MKPPILPLLFVLALISSSCAFHSGMMSANLPESGTYFEFKQIAFGRSSSTRVFGLGGLEKEGLVLEAKKNMYRNYPLNRGEAYANVSVDFKNTFAFIIHTTEVVVSADIVQLGNELSQEPQKIFRDDHLYGNKETPLLKDSNTVIITTKYPPLYGLIVDPDCLISDTFKCDVKGMETGRIKSFRTKGIYKAFGEFKNGYGETLKVGSTVDFYKINASDKTRKNLISNYKVFIYGFKGESVFISRLNRDNVPFDYRTVHYNCLKPVSHE